MGYEIIWVAFKNMLRAAAQDPLWAFVHILRSPFSAGRFLVITGGGALLLCIIFLVFVSWLAGKVGVPEWLFTFPAVVVSFFIMVRVLAAPLVNAFGSVQDDTHGSARFATPAETAKLTLTGGLLIGRDQKNKLLRYDGPAHLLTMAPTRTGKGVGTIVPNLLTANRSIICIDPKGENAKITARARAGFGAVHVLDPFGISGQRSAAFNPLATLDANGLDAAEEAATLADALVHDAPGEAGEAHWNEEAKALIGGIILYVAAEEPAARRSLATLREHLTLAPDAFDELLGRMQATKAAGGLVARAANRHKGKSDREAAGVLSVAQRHTHFLDSPRMVAVLDHSDFSFSDLKKRVGSVFLVLPPDRLNTYARWLRLMVTQALQDMARTPDKPATPVLFLLDEFASLGRLDPVERAMGLMAGYGVQLWPILQDVHQLRATYGQRAGTFLSNAAVLQVFGVNDHDSAKLVSDLLGQETVVFQTMSRAFDSEESGLSSSQHHTGRSLLTPDEVRNLPQQGELIFLAGMRPIMAFKLAYYEDPEFVGLFDPA